MTWFWFWHCFLDTIHFFLKYTCSTDTPRWCSSLVFFSFPERRLKLPTKSHQQKPMTSLLMAIDIDPYWPCLLPNIDGWNNMYIYGGFHQNGLPPIAGWFRVENPLTMDDDLGVPPWLWKPPYVLSDSQTAGCASHVRLPCALPGSGHRWLVRPRWCGGHVFTPAALLIGAGARKRVVKGGCKTDIFCFSSLSAWWFGCHFF